MSVYLSGIITASLQWNQSLFSRIFHLFKLKHWTIKNYTLFISYALSTMIHHCLYEFGYSWVLTEIGSPNLISYDILTQLCKVSLKLIHVLVNAQISFKKKAKQHSVCAYISRWILWFHLWLSIINSTLVNMNIRIMCHCSQFSHVNIQRNHTAFMYLPFL